MTTALLLIALFALIVALALVYDRDDVDIFSRRKP